MVSRRILIIYYRSSVVVGLQCICHLDCVSSPGLCGRPTVYSIHIHGVAHLTHRIVVAISMQFQHTQKKLCPCSAWSNETEHDTVSNASSSQSIESQRLVDSCTPHIESPGSALGPAFTEPRCWPQSSSSTGPPVTREEDQNDNEAG